MIIQKFENIISPFYLEDIQLAVFGSEMTWVHHNETAGGYNGNFAWIEDEQTEETDLFVQKPIPNSTTELLPFKPLIYTLQDMIGSRVHIERVKTNLMLPSVKLKKDSYNRPHVDHSAAYAKTLLFYVNDSDGDTFIFDKTYTGENPGKLEIVERITPKAGTAVLFDSYRYHASSTPTSGKRSAINIIFWTMEDHLKFQTIGTPFSPLPPSFTDPSHIKKFFQKS